MALVTKSIGMPLATTGPKEVGLRKLRRYRAPFRKAVVAKFNTLFARGKKVGNPWDDSIRDVI